MNTARRLELVSPSTPSISSSLPPEMRRLLKREGMFGLGEAYVKGAFRADNLDVLIYDLLGSPEHFPSKWNFTTLFQLAKELLLNPQTGAGAFVVGKRHYDLGNDLFKAMLDTSMSYTCGYWRQAQTLDQAQHAKLDIICRKLKLKPGMRVLDIGCGWGNFAYHAATHYGVSVVGVTVSEQQAQYIRERCKDLPVTVSLTDYSTINETFDRIVSIEMIEAVGRKNLTKYYATIERCLKDGGLCLIQAISTETFSRGSCPAVDQYVVWLLKHIFPNGYLPTFTQLAHPTKGSFVVEDIENLSTDYDLTLQAWQQNFKANWATLQSTYGDEFYRIWEFYLCGCSAFFRRRLVQVYQVVYSKNGYPGGYFLSNS